MIQNILHISDLHYTSDDSSYLRDNQDAFLDELVCEIKSVESKIDYLFLTGDLVERGEWKDANKVLEIVNKLESKLDIKNTFCINGNHDLDDNGQITNEFQEIRQKMRILNPTFENDWFRASLISENHWVFEFDCFCNGKRTVKLSKERDFKPLKDSQLEQFKIFIDEHLKTKGQSIYILSHLPVSVNPDSKLLEDKSWADSHLWKDGKNILELLKSNVDINVLLWFAGDGHVVECYKKSDTPFFFFLTGRFNGPKEKYGEMREKVTHKEASCQFIRVDTIKRNIIRTLQFSTFQENYEQESFKWYSKSLAFVSSTKYLNKFFDGNSKQEELNQIISKAISKDKLYKLVKATTKKKNVSLGWVDINGVLNHDNVLSSFLESTSQLLDLEYKVGYNNMVIVGLGYWGSSIASFIGLNKNIPVISLNVRGCNLIDHSKIIDFLKGKNIIIATDVVSSGETLDELREALNIKDFSCLISVILNPLVADSLRGIDRIIYGSNKIALPILSMEYLPESIINSTYDFERL